ncbi:hypothetical protein Taro_015736 [Colocasia esculenta]|uniref:Uncharacterized protein n=1 Tax=Colocasia esculenta TaxID=4460 RepID=A0A843UU22_COLES|nr:hypothetical protein [Colocasia esculenta]
MVKSGFWLQQSGRDAQRAGAFKLRRQARSRFVEPAVGVEPGAGRDMSTRRVQNATDPLVATLSEITTCRAVATPEGGPSPEKSFCPFSK